MTKYRQTNLEDFTIHQLVFVSKLKDLTYSSIYIKLIE